MVNLMVYKRRKTDAVMRLLNLLGNETRLRILKLLANEPMYVSEIVKTLDVGQQAVIRHLQELESMGLITSYKVESEHGPERKYYQIGRSLRIEITITPEDVRVRTNEISERSINKTSFEEITNRITEMVDVLDRVEKIQDFHTLKETQMSILRRDLERSLSLLRFLEVKINNILKRLQSKKEKSEE